jgi:fructose-bisphosphate aldolase class II
MTDPEEARQFAEETGIDVVAPAVGNMHGLLREIVYGQARKHLDVPRIGEIKRAVGKFMTLHGGSGTADQDFVAAIKAGMTIVQVNTELRLAWRRGVEEGLRKDPNEVAPYKIMTAAYQRVFEGVKERLTLFNAN